MAEPHATQCREFHSGISSGGTVSASGAEQETPSLMRELAGDWARLLLRLPTAGFGPKFEEKSVTEGSAQSWAARLFRHLSRPEGLREAFLVAELLRRPVERW